MDAGETIRWGILGTANIARSAFLPGLRAAGGGSAYAVAGRDQARTERYARDNGIERAIQGYDTLLADEQVDAVYIALPNALHAEWTIAALRAGKAVLCEKPLCTSVDETERVLTVAGETGVLLWEAFVFPFHNQMRRLREIMSNRDVGDIVELQSNFHFMITNRHNIRLSSDLAGGAINDVGCYCLRLARLVFGTEAGDAVVVPRWASEGVDEEAQAIVSYPSERRLVLSCGMFREYDTFARLLGTSGEIRFSNPFHPHSGDMMEIRKPDLTVVENAAGSEPSFTAAIRHIQAVLRGDEAPEHLAIDEALDTARGLELLHGAAQATR